MKNYLIIANRQKDKGLKIAERIRKLLMERGAVCNIFDQYFDVKHHRLEIPEGTECILVIGGDGTLLGVADQLFGKHIPILGVNLGTLGFLTEVTVPMLEDTINHLIRDEFEIEKRFMLRADVIKNGEVTTSFKCLNDFVISRGLLPKLLTLEVRINGTIIDAYRADGLILCTPTGSTGYNLSAGGPIINPTCKNFVMTPICPHSLMTRSVVLSEFDNVTIELKGDQKDKPNIAILSYDVAEGETLVPGDRIRVTKADDYTPFIKMGEKSFVQILKDKLLKP
ncbi:MAG: NAD(+)/NADH kinase [Lachnospiraceae bacterium]|nr:NAD(+)/NADH kinase [Lachnospiraceae bacterium]